MYTYICIVQIHILLTIVGWQEAGMGSSIAKGAAVIGGVAGLAVFGVVGAVAGAGALAYVATRDDKVGELAKTGGEASAPQT